MKQFHDYQNEHTKVCYVFFLFYFPNGVFLSLLAENAPECVSEIPSGKYLLYNNYRLKVLVVLRRPAQHVTPSPPQTLYALLSF